MRLSVCPLSSHLSTFQLGQRRLLLVCILTMYGMLRIPQVQIRRAEDTEGGSTEARVVYPYYDLHYGSSKDHFMACAPRQYREVRVVCGFLRSSVPVLH